MPSEPDIDKDPQPAPPNEPQLGLAAGGAGAPGTTSPEWRTEIDNWRSKFSLRPPDDDWQVAKEVANWLNSLEGVTHSHALNLANWLATDTASCPHTPPMQELRAFLTCVPTAADSAAATADVGAVSPEISAGNVFIGAFYLYRRRFMYQFRDVQKVLREFPQPLQDHAIFVALKAYSVLGDPRRSPLEEDSQRLAAISLARESRTRAADDECGCLEQVVDVCVQAFDLARRPDDFAEETVSWVSEHLQSDTAPEADMAAVFLWRRARAFRRLAFMHRENGEQAKNDLEHGLSDLAQAQERLRTGTDFGQEFAERLVRERDPFELYERIFGHEKAISESAARVTDAEERIERDTASASIRSVEVLSLFSSAVAFAVGVAAIGATAASLRAAVAIGLFLLIGLIAFSILLIVTSSIAVSVVRRRSRGDDVAGRETLVIVLAGSALAAALVSMAVALYFVLS